jgi:Zn-dependent protease with chaperone function
MFYALALLLCLAVVFIVLACATVFCGAGLWAAQRAVNSVAPRISANLLFTMRTLPLFLAFLVALGFALPAFLEFEPHSSGELIGLRLLLLAALGALVIGLVGVRAYRIFTATHRAQRQWRKHAEKLQPEGIDFPVYCADGECPLLAVTGVFRPKIFVSRQVTENLSAGELSAAIAHEMAHVSALDNLKQVLLKVTQPPQWLALFRNSDAAWVNASEMAADEGALASGASALDLSSALVKVGRLSRQFSAGPMVAASRLLPTAPESSIQMRITHLEKLLGKEEMGRPTDANPAGTRRWSVFSALLLVGIYALCLNAILPWMHEALEILVR